MAARRVCIRCVGAPQEVVTWIPFGVTAGFDAFQRDALLALGADPRTQRIASVALRDAGDVPYGTVAPELLSSVVRDNERLDVTVSDIAAVVVVPSGAPADAPPPPVSLPPPPPPPASPVAPPRAAVSDGGGAAAVARGASSGDARGGSNPFAEGTVKHACFHALTHAGRALSTTELARDTRSLYDWTQVRPHRY
jgi:hypothetical protein